MAKVDPNIAAHLEWIGFVKPRGLVVSAPALVSAGAILNRRDAEGQNLLKQCIERRPTGLETEPRLPDFRAFAKTVLGWNFSPKGYAGTEQNPIPAGLEVRLPESGAILRPDFAVRERGSPGAPPGGSASGAGTSLSKEGEKWQLLVRVLASGTDFDEVAHGGAGIDASPHSQLERLLRESGVSAGVLFNGLALRLVSAPRGESSGWLDFRVADMVLTAGRPICTALRLLLSEQRLLSLPTNKRLAALLAESRRFQNKVSEDLAEQVLHSLYELLRGLQAADDATKGDLLRDHLADSPDEIYRALLTVVLRLVFLLYAEERDMLPHEDATFERHYSLSGLYERLREDAALYPDTMEQRYGAWAQLIALFRMVHDGAHSRAMWMPARRGVLFDPERYRFLEGRCVDHARGERIEAPLVPDGTVYRVLEKLLVLNGERISYRALDVEHVGSVYETMMGFRLETAEGRSIAIRVTKKHGAPVTVDLEELLAEAPKNRAQWIRERTDLKLSEKVGNGVKESTTLEGLHAALDSVIDRDSTPDLVPQGAMVLQPSEERRRSGSHYTPRELTEPIVRKALEPILDRLRTKDGKPPCPEEILDLKICDPAVGSGAFLVEACRILGEELVASWHAHNEVPNLQFGEEEIIHARRMVARRCLYGVDRNPVAVDLTKLSLRLVTLTRNQSFAFVDHAIRHGDSLVGLTQRQIETFHWKGNAPRFQEGFEAMRVRNQVEQVAELRERIRRATERESDVELRSLWRETQDSLNWLRLFGDLIIVAYFDADKPKDKEAKRQEFAAIVSDDRAEINSGLLLGHRSSNRPLNPFHWEIEFPEVFQRENEGFDSIIGNPPFAGKNTIAAGNIPRYAAWLKDLHPEGHGNSDLVAHFFRRSFGIIRQNGTLGLIATNTIAQGDTRSTGLRWICTHGGEIYGAHRRYEWPGPATVVVSIVHIIRGNHEGELLLDGNRVGQISAFLFHSGGDDDPNRLKENKGKSFQGTVILGMGFTFDDKNTKGKATRLCELQSLIDRDQSNNDVVFPYIGGEELNANPAHLHHRYVINFADYPLSRAILDQNWTSANRQQRESWVQSGIVPHDYPNPVADDWPDLLNIVEANVKPQRMNDNEERRRKLWWQFGRRRPNLYSTISGLSRVLAINCGATQHFAFAFLPNDMVFANTLAIIAYQTYAMFCLLQSRVHEIWARFFGSSLGDGLRYTPSDCFETFPLAINKKSTDELESVGQAYYDFRANLMNRNNQGLTKTYNRFHDPSENDREILKLRELHALMDKAVLDAYGWTDILASCDFVGGNQTDANESATRTQSVRYRWPDAVRDEVLRRLLELNAERAAKE